MSSKQAEGVTLTAGVVANIRATMMVLSSSSHRTYTQQANNIQNIESLDVNWAGVREITGVSSNGNA